MTLSNAIALLAKYTQAVPYDVKTLSDLTVKPAPGKWSKLEIMGHLIDSAINNLKRFTDAQYSSQPYRVVPYQQDELVLINNYQQLPVEQVVALWQLLNLQMQVIMQGVPLHKLNYVIITPGGDVRTLEWLMIDYVEHLEHHLLQVFGTLPN